MVMGYCRKKNKRRGMGWGGGGAGGWGHTSLKPPGIFTLLLYPWIFPEKQSSTLGTSTIQTFVRSLGNSKTKNRPLEIPHYFFLATLGNSASFLINPWKFHMLFLWFLWYPWKFHILNPWGGVSSGVLSQELYLSNFGDHRPSRSGDYYNFTL